MVTVLEKIIELSSKYQTSVYMAQTNIILRVITTNPVLKTFRDEFNYWLRFYWLSEDIVSTGLKPYPVFWANLFFSLDPLTDYSGLLSQVLNDQDLLRDWYHPDNNAIVDLYHYLRLGTISSDRYVPKYWTDLITDPLINPLYTVQTFLFLKEHKLSVPKYLDPIYFFLTEITTPEAE